MDNNYRKKKEVKRSTKNMPNSYEAEQYVLGAIMIDNALGQDSLGLIAEEDFYANSHKLIYSHVRQLLSTGKPVDAVALSDSLDKVGDIESVGGVQYLFELYNAVPSTANFKHYADIVMRDGKLRKLISACADITDNACGSSDAMTSMALAEKKIFDLTFSQEIKDLAHVSEGVNTVLKETEELMRSPVRIKGLQTGFKQLDDIVHGYKEGQMIVLAARPGCGKTSFAMNIATNIALAHPEKVIAVFNLEMGLTELSQRLLFSVSGVKQDMIFKGDDTTLFDKLWNAKQRLDKTKIFVDDSAAASPEKIASKLRRIKQKQKRLDFVVIDYLQLMRMEKSLASLQHEVTEISRAIKLMAKELRVPILILSQTSRGLERRDDKTPMMSDLRDSGSIEQDADQVYFLTKDETDTGEDFEVVTLHIVKNRSGASGTVPLKWQGDLVRFSNLDRVTYEQIKEAAKLRGKDNADDQEGKKTKRKSTPKDDSDGDGQSMADIAKAIQLVEPPMPVNYIEEQNSTIVPAVEEQNSSSELAAEQNSGIEPVVDVSVMEPEAQETAEPINEVPPTNEVPPKVDFSSDIDDLIVTSKIAKPME